jgi:ComF family protein
VAVRHAAKRVRCVFSRNYGSLTIDVPPSETTRWRAVARVLRSPLDAVSGVIFSTVYPTSCSLCGNPMPQFSYAPICDVCRDEVATDAHDRCTYLCVCCGDHVEGASQSPEQAHCPACLEERPAFEKAVFYGLYRKRMRDAIHALKYGRLTPVARVLGKMLATAIEDLYDAAPREMLVVPVPLHKRKTGERGFNQARLLTRQALKVLRRRRPEWKLTLADRTVLRTRHTKSQAGLTADERRKNLKGAFGVTDPKAVRGRHVLVVDDILTTGATARATALALKDAGAETVWVATLARARRDVNSVNHYSQETNYSTGEPDLRGKGEPLRTDNMFLSSTSSTT